MSRLYRFEIVVCEDCRKDFRPLYAKACGASGRNIPGGEETVDDGTCELCGGDLHNGSWSSAHAEGKGTK